jgi:4-amino-4-deoxy-L-arabinose transferase-like glycosyltransferase
MPGERGRFSAGRFGAKLGFAVLVFAVLAFAIISQPAKRLIDFDQTFYLTIAYDIERHGVFSNGPFDDVDSTRTAPPPGMFFAPLYPSLVLAVMRLDPRFARAVKCSVEANHGKRDLAGCDAYAMPMLLVHALLLTLGVLAIARCAELIIGNRHAFYLAGALAAAGAAAEAELFSYVMTGSLSFSLFSLTMMAVVVGLKSSRKAYFLAAGLLLGALCLTKPSFLVVFPALMVVMVAHARWFSTQGLRSELRSIGTFAIAFAIAVGPWLGRNYLSVGKLKFTEEYGSVTIIERFAFNTMTGREFALAFPYCVPTVGAPLVDRLFGPEAMARFDWDQPGSFFQVGRAQRLALLETHERLDPVIGDIVLTEMHRSGWNHLATIVPLGWCGLWVGGPWSLFVLPMFAVACFWAIRRGRPLFLFYAVPALVLVGMHAAVANHYPRYNLAIIGPFSVGAAWILARGLRRRDPEELEAESRA